MKICHASDARDMPFTSSDDVYDDGHTTYYYVYDKQVTQHDDKLSKCQSQNQVKSGVNWTLSAQLIIRLNEY